MRIQLEQNTIFFVNPVNGNDSNDGLTQQTAWKHVQFACDQMISSYDHGGCSTTIQLADGTYNESVAIVGDLTGAVQFHLTGNLAHPEYVLWNVAPFTCGIEARDKSCVTIEGIKFISQGNGCRALKASQFGILDFGTVEFASFPAGVHVEIYQSGSVNVIGSYKVSGGAILHFQLSGNSMLCLGARPVNFTNPVTFDSFVDVTYGSYLWAVGQTIYSGGPVTGIKYRVHTNSTVNSSQTQFPGNYQGIISLGGQFI